MRALSRRHFIGGLGGLALAPLAAKSTPWANWSGGVSANPAQWLYPASELELAQAVREATQVRAVGGSHSFSPIVPTSGTLISLEGLSGLIRHDASSQQATLWAGTRLMHAGAALAAVGQSMMNEPDINLQSLGGSVSTAVHGTGRQLQCISAYVRGLRLVTANGELLDCSATQHPEVFAAASVAVGSMGVITQITLQNAPLYRVRETITVMSLDEALARVEAEKDQHRHIEFLAFLDGEEAIVKRHDVVDEPEDLPPHEDDNALLDFAANTSRRMPWLNGWIQDLLGLFVEDSTRVGEGWKVFASPRSVPFNEMEYQVPAEVGFACFREVAQAIRDAGIQVFFPLEFRFVKGDDVWLSPFYGRDSVSISVHQYYQQDYRPLFAVAEPIFRKHGGRPHWGKIHTLSAPELAALYPRWQDFQAVRKHHDPAGKFLNPYLRQLFGEAGTI